MNLSILATVGGIALVDIVLSGDNALVIGAAASKLPRGQRLVAVIWGGLGAVILRLLLAGIATELMTITYLQAAGGVILFFIAVRLLLPESERRHVRPAADRFFHAIVTIMLADVTMSLDNVLAVGALAAGNIPLLVAGLILSMALLFVASTLIARLMDHVTWLLDVAALVLGWTAANLILEDPAAVAILGLQGRTNVVLAIHFAFLALVLVIDLCLRAYVAHKQLMRANIIEVDEAFEATPPETLVEAAPVAPSAALSDARADADLNGATVPRDTVQPDHHSGIPAPRE